MNAFLTNSVIGALATILYTLAQPLLRERVSCYAQLMLCRICLLAYIFPFYLIKVFLLYTNLIPKNAGKIQHYYSYMERVITTQPGNIYLSFRLKIEYALLSLWILCILGIFTWRLFNYLRIKKFVQKHAELIQSDQIKSLLLDTKKELGIYKHVSCFSLASSMPPFSVGILHPTIYLPEDILKNEVVIKPVIRHELQHIKSNDVFFSNLMFIIQCLHFFNPTVYLIAAHDNFNQELNCDYFAVKSLDKKNKMFYAQEIIRAASYSNRWDNHFMQFLGKEHKKIKRRLEYIMSSNKRKASKPLAIITGMGITLLCGITSLAYQPPEILSFKKNPEVLDHGVSTYIGPYNQENPFYQKEYEIVFDEQIIDTHGKIHEYNPTVIEGRDACNHTYTTGTRTSHRKESSGGCRVTVYEIEYCTKCDYIVEQTELYTITYKVCPH